MLGKKNEDLKMNTLIGAGAELNGDFTLDGSARIDGKIGGNVTVTGNLILGAGSVVTGEVQAASVLIGGEVTGNITAPEKAELTASAKVLGDIATKVIVIDEHANFCNYISNIFGKIKEKDVGDYLPTSFFSIRPNTRS